MRVAGGGGGGGGGGLSSSIPIHYQENVTLTAGHMSKLLRGPLSPTVE